MRFKLPIISFIVYVYTRCIAATLRLRVVGEERVTNLQKAGQGVILVTWHGRTLIPITRFRGRGYWAFISTSRDGEYQDRIFRLYGWQTVRGSTSARGAVQSALTMIKHLKAGATLAHTPDGPRGPRGQVHAGAIFLAQKSGCPIIPDCISAAPRSQLSTWDRYLVPHLFARGVWIYGEPITIPPNASPEEQHEAALRIGAAIDALEEEAERLVRAGRRARAQDVGECRPA